MGVLIETSIYYIRLRKVTTATAIANALSRGSGGMPPQENSANMDY